MYAYFTFTSDNYEKKKNNRNIFGQIFTIKD